MEDEKKAFRTFIAIQNLETLLEDCVEGGHDLKGGL
jgi:hypothetical protein